MGMSTNTQGQAALTAVTDVIKESFWFTGNRLLFLHSRKCQSFAIIFYVIFVGEELTVLWFAKGE